jgi:OOP family OmpA-OmpF porin
VKSRIRNIVVASVALACAATAFAQSGNGLYVGGSVGNSHWKGDDLGGVANDASDTGFKVYGGYAFTPNLGLELGYADLGKFNGPLGDLKASGAYLDAVGTVPLGMNFSALGRIGLFNGRLEKQSAGIDDSERGTKWKVGLGLQYDLSQSTAIRGEWERYRFDALNVNADADLYSIGINYRF